MNKLFVISGSSGVGKGTVLKELLLNNPEIKLSISTTTRTPRYGEVHGVHYFYVSKDEFKKSVENDEFLEWAEFSGNYYGTKKNFVNECINNGCNLILEIDTQGALQIKQKMTDAVLIFIAPPSMKELENRLINRGTETQEAIKKRLDFVRLEQENSKKYDYTVINDKVERAVKELELIIEKECNG